MTEVPENTANSADVPHAKTSGLPLLALAIIALVDALLLATLIAAELFASERVMHLLDSFGVARWSQTDLAWELGLALFLFGLGTGLTAVILGRRLLRALAEGRSIEVDTRRREAVAVRAAVVIGNVGVCALGLMLLGTAGFWLFLFALPHPKC